jgi:aminobenzoyl-glutamate transport protein
MQSIVPLLFLGFLIPGAIYGAIAGTLRGHRAIVQAMAASMSTMGYYLVIAFGAALFTDAFKQSNLGALVSVAGAEGLKALAVPPAVLIVGVLLLAALIDLAIGSASAKWAVLAPIFVPMLMQVGLSPELTQAAYRIGDSTSNIVTPLMPYFPLVVVWAQRWSKDTGIGTLAATMLPYSLAFLTTWTALLLLFWGFDVPLGLQASYTWPR